MAMTTLVKSVIDAIGPCQCRVVPSNGTTLAAVMSVVRVPVGIFGIPPQHTPESGVYIEPEDSRVVADFKFWAAPVNQKLVCTLGAFERLTGFTMVIDAMVPEATLQATYDEASDGTGCFQDETCLPYLPKWTARFGWIYVPLAGDENMAIFATSRQNQGLVEQLDAALRSGGIGSMEANIVLKLPD